MTKNFREQWIELLSKLATGTRRIRTLLTPVGVIIFGLFTAVFIAGALAVDDWFDFPLLLPEPARIFLSVPILLIAGFATGWSVIHFLRAKGTPVPANPPPELVATGPYKHTRNPMLSGVFGLLFGVGLLLGSISLTFIFTPLFILVNYWELKYIEEPELVQRLGEEYLAYRRKTPMFIPRIRDLIR